MAILWHETWHEGLEEASRLYFGERNESGMFRTLEPLHAMMERGPQTLKEMSFNQVSVSAFNFLFVLQSAECPVDVISLSAYMVEVRCSSEVFIFILGTLG